MGSLKRIAVLCGFTVLFAGAAHAEDWQVAKDEDGIKVSLSEIAGSKYKAYRGVTTIKAPVAKIQALQENAVEACSWIHECKSQKLLKQDGDVAYTYTQFKAPFPVTDRDSILKITTTKTADGTVTRQLLEVPAYQPEVKGYVRVAQVDGYWKLVPKGDNLTEVTYQVHTEPGGSVPSWLANKFVVDAPFNTLKALREHAEK
ncbi:MAG: hypothetical protein GAK37_02365 [Pseudomonas sp.]|nr:MAG: hypothetical protein GAK37_02365 [Pseudomonas sp.]